MSDYLYPGAHALQQQRNTTQRSQPVPCSSYSTGSMPPTITTSEQATVTTGYTAEQLHASGYGVASNVMAPAALIYAPSVMPLYPPAPLTYGKAQSQQSSMQLHALSHFQEGANNPYQQTSLSAFQQAAPYPAYQQYGLLPLFQPKPPSAPAYQSFDLRSQSPSLQAFVPPVGPQSLLASLSQGQGLRRSQAVAEEAHQKQSVLGLSPGSGPALTATTASQQSLLGLSSGSLPSLVTASHQSRLGNQMSPGLGPQRLKTPDDPPIEHVTESAEIGLPPRDLSAPPPSRSPSLEEQLQAEFEYTRLPSVPRRKDYAQMDAERPKLMGKSKIFVRSKVRTQKGLDRRERKNASARANAATKRSLVEELGIRERSQMTSEEIDLMEKSETARERKNRRSHESHTEKKNEIDRILSKAPKERTPIEEKFLEQELSAKRRKNEGDRLRRLRLKELGYAPSRNTGKIGIPARGPIPPGTSGTSGASVSTTTSATESATAAAAGAARSDGFSIATGQSRSPTNEGTLLTYGYQ